MSPAEDKIPTLPNFDLEALTSYDPKIFEPTDEFEKRIAGFVLSLSLVFNDFKGIEWWRMQLEKGRRPGSDVTPYHGQHVGMRTQIARLNLALFHELLELVDHHKDVIDDARFNIYVSAMTSEAKTKWQSLKNFAFNRGKKNHRGQQFQVFTHKLRSKTAFHYDSKMLLRGYQSFFTKSIPHAARAFASVGNDMESSRFYYADAAAQESLVLTFSDYEIDQKEIHRYRQLFNLPIHGLITSFLKTRQTQLDNIEVSPTSGV